MKEDFKLTIKAPLQINTLYYIGTFMNVQATRVNIVIHPPAVNTAHPGFH